MSYRDQGSVVVASLHGEGDYYNGVIMGADTWAMLIDHMNEDDGIIVPGILPKIIWTLGMSPKM